MFNLCFIFIKSTDLTIRSTEVTAALLGREKTAGDQCCSVAFWQTMLVGLGVLVDPQTCSAVRRECFLPSFKENECSIC